MAGNHEMPISLRERLISGGQRLAIEISDDDASKIIKYLILLMKWGSHINLVGTSKDHEIISRHVVDCLALLPHLSPTTSAIVDVGSGAGLPGAILAIFRPGIEVTALEPVHKKYAFLNAVRREIPLPNFHPSATRVEEFVKTETTASFEVAVSRATFALPEWLALGATLIGPGGTVLGMEGSEQCELPDRATRHTYSLDDRTRAIIVYRPR